MAHQLGSSGFRQLVKPLDEMTLETHTELQEAAKNASRSLSIGIHADGATEAIVEEALHCAKQYFGKLTTNMMKVIQYKQRVRL
jgi:hypothetical protein